MKARGAYGARAGLALFFGLLALSLSWGLRVSRVHHGDEIWTFDALQQSYASLLTFVLGQDNHPPLYYLMAKAWTQAVGNSIESLRWLSYLFSLLVLASFGWFHFRFRSVAFFAPLLLLATNPLFIYYAATVRPYAMVVFLSSILTLSALVLRAQPGLGSGMNSSVAPLALSGKGRVALQILFYGSALLLGLTHYYGTLLAFILLVWDFFERRISGSRLTGVMVAVLLLAWPFFQLSFGTLDRQIESNAWVNVMPFVSTLNNLLMGVFPAQLLSKSPQYIFSLFLLLFALAGLLTPHRVRALRCWLSRASSCPCDELYLGAVVLIIYLLSAFADLRKPFSTPYYFLVCLPAIAILFGSFNRLSIKHYRAVPVALGLAGVVIAQIVLARQRLALP